MQSILIVEDEALIALELQAMLQDLGHTVCAVAIDASEAVAAAEALRPDLVLMDVRLASGTSGVEAAIAIRQRFGIPSIFLSANIDPSVREAARPARPLGFIDKPFSLATLQRTLADATARAVPAEV